MPAATSQELRPRRGVHSFTALVPTTLSPGTSRYGPSTVAMYTKHQISISRALIPTAGRILRNRQPASSSAFNAAEAQGVVRVFNQTPVPLPPKRRPCISNLPAEDPLALCEVDRDKASLALPRRSAGGVAVTSPHYTVNVSPARRRKLQLTFTFGNRVATVRTGWNSSRHLEWAAVAAPGRTDFGRLSQRGCQNPLPCNPRGVPIC